MPKISASENMAKVPGMLLICLVLATVKYYKWTR